jgi:hypothetical protein
VIVDSALEILDEVQELKPLDPLEDYYTAFRALKEPWNNLIDTAKLYPFDFSLFWID